MKVQLVGKSLLLCLVLAVTSAQAGLIVINPNTDVTAYGFGTNPSILTLQAKTLEQGCVAPASSDPFYTTSGCGTTGIGLVSGNNKYAAPTLASLGVDGWANLGILLNVNEPGSPTGQSQAVTLQSLTLTLYNPTTLLAAGSFSLANPVDITNIAQGQGGAGFIISIETSQFGRLEFSDEYRVGLSAQIGCTLTPTDCGAIGAAGNWMTDDGPESFTIASLAGGGPQEIPEPATAALLGGGLLVFAWALRRRKVS